MLGQKEIKILSALESHKRIFETNIFERWKLLFRTEDSRLKKTKRKLVLILKKQIQEILSSIQQRPWRCCMLLFSGR